MNGLGCDLPLRSYERYPCRRDKTRDPVVPLPGFLAKKGATGHGDRDRRAAQTGHEGERSLRYDHMEGERFRHTAQFKRWRPDRDPRSCTYSQLERPVTFSLGDIVAGLGPGNR